MMMESSDDDTITQAIQTSKTRDFSNGKSKAEIELENNRARMAQQEKDMTSGEQHFHPNGEVCNCKEKMFEVKKQLRERNWNRRKTIILTQGTVIGKDQVALPDLQKEKSSAILKEKFKNFERKLTVMADSAKIDTIAPGLVKKIEKKMQMNK